MITSDEFKKIEIIDFLNLEKLSKEETQTLMNCWWQSKLSKFFVSFDYKAEKDKDSFRKLFSLIDFESLLLLKNSPSLNISGNYYDNQALPFLHFLFLSHWYFASLIKDFLPEYKKIINIRNSLGETSLHVFLKSCLYRENDKRGNYLFDTILNNTSGRPDEIINNIDCFSILNENIKILENKINNGTVNMTLTSSLKFHNNMLDKINKKILLLDLEEKLIVRNEILKTKI